MYVFIPIKGTKRENIFFFFPRGKGKFRDEEEEGLIEEKTKIDPYPIPDIEKQNFTKLYIRKYIVSRGDVSFGGGRASASTLCAVPLDRFSSLRSCERSLEETNGPTTIINHLFFASFRRRVSGIGKFGSPPRGAAYINQSSPRLFRPVARKLIRNLPACRLASIIAGGNKRKKEKKDKD